MARLIISLLFLLLSLLCLFYAPAIHLWDLSYLVTEFSWIFLIISTLLLLWGFVVKAYHTAGTIASVLAFLFFLSPIAGACYISSSLDGRIAAAFGYCGLPRGADKQPFSFRRLWAPSKGQDVPYVTLPYSSCAEGPLTLDYYKARANTKRPCLVVVHGGAWVAGNSQQFPDLNSYLATAGYNVATINYRLAPTYRSPAPVEDVHVAMAYLRAHANELSLDTNNFVLLGRSAGGQIVLVAAYTLHEPGLKGVIDVYGPTDLVWWSRHPAHPRALNSDQIMEEYLGGTYKEIPEQYALASATHLVTAQSVPTLIIHGKKDQLVDYKLGLLLDKKLHEHGVQHFLLSLPWAPHGCDFKLNGPSGQLCTYAIERFMDCVTRSAQ